MRRRAYLSGAAATFAVALALRLGPLWWSPLPFNPDGIGYAARARDALAAGGVPVAGTATDQFGFTALLAVVARATGHPPITVAQPISALLGAVSCLFAVGLARRVAAGAGLPERRARGAGVLAGLLLAVDGLYLYRSMPTDEQTAGLLLVPAFAVAAWAALRTGRWGWRGVALALFAALPPLHNLTGLVAATVLSALLAIRVVDRPGARSAATAVALGAGGWLWALGYHPATAALSGAVVVQVGRLARVPGVFVAWVALAVAFAGWFHTTGRRLRRGALAAAVGAPFALLAANAVRAVYPGTPATPPTLLWTLGALAVPVAVGTLAVDRFVDARSAGPAALAAIVGPLAVVGFSLTGGLTVPYLSTAYRAQLFVHLPVLVGAGVGAVALLERYGDGGTRRSLGTALRVGLPVVLVVSAGASAPVAFAGLELLTYRGLTTPAEFSATGYAAEEFPRWATDDHLARVAGYFGSATATGPAGRPLRVGGARGPVRRWLVEGGPPPDCPVLAQRSWTTTGAQFHPAPPARVDADRFDRWLAARDVVYATGRRDPLSVVRARNATAAGAPNGSACRP